MTRITGEHARLYESVRSAHLERARELEPAAILYRQRRYDFDESATEGLELIRASPLRAAWLLVRSKVRVLEINEPLQASSAPATALAVGALGIARLVGRPRTTVVCYAIENADPGSFPVPRRMRSRVRRAAESFLSRRVWARVDRIAYGTSQARDLYETVLPSHRRPLASEVIPALPAPLPEAGTAPRQATAVVFLGALVERKGFPLVIAAWEHVRSRRPDARLTILGKGALHEEADQLARRDPTVTFRPDPPRDLIRDTLLGAHVLTLPSQPRPDWREQVGLPIVEGLAAGCTIVTTTETGLADWLAANGHRTLAVPTDPVALADAIVEALDDPRAPADVVAGLPALDGRLAADQWLFGTAPKLLADQPPAVADPSPAGHQRRS